MMMIFPEMYLGTCENVKEIATGNYYSLQKSVQQLISSTKILLTIYLEI